MNVAWHWEFNYDTQSHSADVYDANGNTLSDPSGKSYSWDFENRLTQAVVPGTGTVTFKYDPFGRRIYKSSPSFTGIFAYDGDNLIETTNASGGEVASYTQTQKIDEPLAELRGSTSDYYEADGLGSITSLSSSAGAVANTYTYDSFGNVTNFTGTLRNPFQYTGRESDPETGLYYNRARYYDPTAGRFVSEDPIGFRGGIDFYDYVFNNPLLWSDPRGLEVQMCTKFWHPHTFICVNGDCSGKYPSGNPIWSPGQIQNDSSNQSHAHCGKVPNNTPCFEQCVAKYIKRRGPSGDIYDFMFANCGQWAEDVVTECRTQCSKSK